MGITILFGVAIVALLAWPQIQKYQAEKEFKAWQAAERVRKQIEQDEFCKMVTSNGKNINPFGTCKDWRPK